MADDDEWRFSIDEVGPDEPEDRDESPEPDEADEEWMTVVGEDDDGPTVGIMTGDPEDAEDNDGNVAGTLTPEAPVEPGTPDLENVVFVTAGVILTVLVFAAVVVPLDAVTAGAIAGGIVAGAALLYVFFRHY